jgi:hypothetical protein
MALCMGLPSSWFLTAMGQPIISIPGYITAEALLSMLKDVNEVSVGGLILVFHNVGSAFGDL